MKKYTFLAIICIASLLSTLAFADLTLRVKITGISGPLLKNAEDRLNVLQQSYSPNLTEKNIQTFYQHAANNISKALEPFGYFRASVQPVALTHARDEWTAHFAVNPGPALPVKQIEIIVSGPGKDDPKLTKLIQNFPIKSGKTFVAETYESAKNALLQTANDQGYLNASFVKKEVRINLKNYSAEITLHLRTGPRYYFGPVNFNLTPFSNEFLQRFVTFKQGEPFSSQKLLKLQQDLGNSHYFKEVIVTPETKQAKNLQVPINVFLTVPKAKQYNLGFGYGTFTGARITLGTEIRRIGASGQYFTAQIKFSPVLKGLAAKYFIPGKNPLTDQYIIGADAQKFSPKNGESFSETLSASYGKKIQEWQNTISTNYLIERYQVTGESAEVSRLLYPSYTLSRMKTDNMLSPTKGSAISLTLQGANQHILSSSSFVQAELKGKYIYSFDSLGKIIVRGDLGYTVVNDLSRLPLTLRFFAGGLGSVRGYPYSSIGPGRYLEVGSIEYQHKIIGDLDGAIFYDAGTATDHFNDAFQRGSGVGVIYNSVIGPVALYVARALSTNGQPTRIEFSIGPQF